ncbi:MAG TPA: hypothetical protein VEZ20_14635 [Allosphingosinicella sp.]|jgi:hypothetical protein|nr:hypothetical protein [Allosphingosinicella sp.]
MDYDPVTGVERKRSVWSWLALPLIAFLLGLAAMGWLLSRWEQGAVFLGIADPPSDIAEQQPLEPAAPQPAQPQEAVVALPGDQPRFVIDPETQQRVSRLEQRLTELDSASRAAVGNADRAEGLLVAFAARRALDRGVALGYIEHLLRQRFGQNQPQAVGLVITAARQPVTLQELQRELEDVGPRLAASGADRSWWEGLKREMGSLITIRREGTQSTIPSERLRRARAHMAGGEVNLALVEILRMPGREQARTWVEKARRYVAARSALDAIETAALLDPVNPPQAPVNQQPQPARPAQAQPQPKAPLQPQAQPAPGPTR